MQQLSGSLTQTLSPWQPGAFALVVFAVLVAGLIGVILFLTFWLNPRRDEREKARPYECSMLPTGQARFNYPTPFYLVATFFLLFDAEAVYVLTWALSFDRLDLAGWLHITFFIGVLLLSLFYIWRKGGLEWSVRPQR
ncbi:NAD(P)H-quinone oxidoreductase subunit 3 [Desulfovibrio sp. X2]|uniref:NADH-quinone oxidoreductase subunit A n=1 Tax=Desulfovibrio sp. X2 TaxID=941449 RepID=UPI000358E5B3|nr:NADH-quinone oxidoreductase subunit A [Desulfovibrio sp. X2]EPR43558.1 NAD(P)H-quinone oxidoreductase subunit 3 [Desulfovibrio sp. X2]